MNDELQVALDILMDGCASDAAAAWAIAILDAYDSRCPLTGVLPGSFCVRTYSALDCRITPIGSRASSASSSFRNGAVKSRSGSRVGRAGRMWSVSRRPAPGQSWLHRATELSASGSASYRKRYYSKSGARDLRP